MTAFADLADAIELGRLMHPHWAQVRGHTFEAADGKVLSAWDADRPDITGACAMGFAYAGGYHERFKGIPALATKEQRDTDGAARGLALRLNDKEARPLDEIVAALREIA